jgi:hypothetical protein
VKREAYILPGRFGDIIQMLPALKAKAMQAGERVVVVTSEDYAGVFDGVSYVQAGTVKGQWHKIVPEAKRLCKAEGYTPVVVQWWADAPYFWDTGPKRAYGRMESDPYQARNYGESMHRAMGFGAILPGPVVFDKRDLGRELRLAMRVIQRAAAEKPVLLVALTGGVSSLFPAFPEVATALVPFAKDFRMVNVSMFSAERIYDLLGLYDIAAGLLTSDSSSLHLAGASKVPFVAYTHEGWSGSVPRGNCVLEIKYGDAMKRMDELKAVLSKWAETKTLAA